MHDDLLERRLKAALHDEAAAQSFTITAPELERRAVLRGGATGKRRLTLLLAAAVGIGLVGLGGVVGGALTSREPAPTAPAIAVDPSPTSPRIGPAPAVLPTLQELIDAGGARNLVIAQAHGPDHGGESLAGNLANRTGGSSLGTLAPGITYTLRVTCLGTGSVDLDVRHEGQRGPLGPTGPRIPCDGAIHEEAITPPAAQYVLIAGLATAAWRIAIHASPEIDNPPVLPGAPGPPDLVAPDGEDTLIEDAFTTPTVGGSAGPAQNGLALVPLSGGLLPRPVYNAQLWCADGTALRYIHGTRTEDDLIVHTATQVPCDGSLHEIQLVLPQGEGFEPFLAATPGSRVALLVSSAEPPIELVREEPGWTLSSGFGPNYAFDTEDHSFTGLGDQNGPGPARVAFACVAPDPATVIIEVELHAPVGDDTPDATYPVDCGETPSVTSMTFPDAEEYLTVRWTSLADMWTALSFLSADPAE